jgi:hypothetical protein
MNTRDGTTAGGHARRQVTGRFSGQSRCAHRPGRVPALPVPVRVESATRPTFWGGGAARSSVAEARERPAPAALRARRLRRRPDAPARADVGQGPHRRGRSLPYGTDHRPGPTGRMPTPILVYAGLLRGSAAAASCTAAPSSISPSPPTRPLRACRAPGSPARSHRTAAAGLAAARPPPHPVWPPRSRTLPASRLSADKAIPRRRHGLKAPDEVGEATEELAPPRLLIRAPPCCPVLEPLRPSGDRLRRRQPPRIGTSRHPAPESLRPPSAAFFDGGGMTRDPDTTAEPAGLGKRPRLGATATSRQRTVGRRVRHEPPTCRFMSVFPTCGMVRDFCIECRTLTDGGTDLLQAPGMSAPAA